MKTRSYDHLCGLAFALDVVGERWALLIVRELLPGPRRFSDLLAGMPGVATNTLTTRLEELEHHGVIARETLAPPAASSVYKLTLKGLRLEPAIVALVRWARPDVGRARAERRRLAPLRASWLAIALKAFYAPGKARGQIVLELPTGSLFVAVGSAGLQIRDATQSDRPQARLTCPEDLVIALVTEEATLAQAARHPKAKIEGDFKALGRVLTAFRRAP